MSSQSKVAVVTGAGSGIGRASALALLKAGYCVTLTGRRQQALEESIAAAGGDASRALACPADISRPDQVRAVFEQTVGRFGRVDVLFNNAGQNAPGVLFEDLSFEKWQAVVDTNLTGSFLCAQAAYPALCDSGHGRIVNMASMAGRATSTLGGVHYTTAKAGVLGLTRHLAREWARDGITVNAISPGIVDTPMVRGSTDAARMKEVLAAIPMGRLADAAEIAALVAFLASDEAAYITGANVDIHGGELIIA